MRISYASIVLSASYPRSGHAFWSRGRLPLGNPARNLLEEGTSGPSQMNTGVKGRRREGIRPTGTVSGPEEHSPAVGYSILPG